MKIAVYTIALNEEQFVEAWYNSAKEADYLLIADTGSTDNTIKKAKKLGINVISVSVSPWRFDVGRNCSLAALPLDIDYCVALDMDETLQEGWRPELERLFESGVTRPRYQYTWSWKEDGTPGLQYGGDKIHTRKGYVWKHPVHEVIRADRLEETQGWCGLEIHHHPDVTKPRSSYLPLLELSVKEDPSDDRNAYYYARELYFYGEKEKAAKEFRRHLELPKAIWKPERAASMRYLAKCEPENSEKWFIAATLEDPNRREPCVDLARFYYENSEWAKCYEATNAALNIEEKPLDYLCEEFAWGALPWDLGAISAYYLGLTKEALELGTKALELDPTNKRLANNLVFYKGK
jgi:glycosyltransferase involved in cell wall biosynthesis